MIPIPILALDTTSRHASIALSTGEDIILEYNFLARQELSASLIPTIESILNELGLRLTDIAAFGVGIGPGLFTGIRVGLATLKGLLFAKQKPVVGVVTLKALAYKYVDEDLISPIVPLIDAKRDEVYTAVYNIGRDHAEEIIPPGLQHIQELKKNLAGVTDLYFVGSGAGAHRKILEKDFPGCKIFQRSSFLAAEICRITYREFLKKNYITNLQELLPLYIRKPDAEQRLLENKDRK